MKFKDIKITRGKDTFDALLVEDYFVFGPVAMAQRKDWVAAGLKGDIGLNELMQMEESYIRDEAMGIPPRIIGWHTELCHENPESRKVNEIPPPVLGRPMNLRVSGGRLRGDALFTRPKAIEAVKRGLLPKWSAEVTGYPLRIVAFAATHGGRAHFGNEVPDLDPEAEKWRAAAKSDLGLDKDAQACAILAHTSDGVSETTERQEPTKDTVMDEKALKELLKAQREEFLKDVGTLIDTKVAEAIKTMKAQGITDPAKSTGDTGKPGEPVTLSAAALEERDKTTAARVKAELQAESKLKDDARNIKAAGAPLTEDAIIAELKKLPEDAREQGVKRMMAEAKLHKAEGTPEGQNPPVTDLGATYDKLLAEGKVATPPKGAELSYKQGWMTAAKQMQPAK